MKKQNRASRGKGKKKGKATQFQSSGIFAGADFLEWRKEVESRGEEIGYAEVGFTEQYLYRRAGNQYALAVQWNEVCPDGVWLNMVQWEARHPNWIVSDEMLEAIPVAKRRTVCTLLPIKRSDAVQWLNSNIIENLIPSEFRTDFRRGIADAAMATPTAVTYKKALIALLKLPDNATGKAIDAAIASATG